MKILVKVYPQRSHFNATFRLARALRDRGHEVIYAGLAPLRNHVVAQGFAFHVQESDVFPWVEQSAQPTRLRWTTWMRARLRHLISVVARRHELFFVQDPLTPLVRELGADLVLVDSPYTFFALDLIKAGVPFAIMESMMNLDRDRDCPPLDTDLVPTQRAFSRALIRLSWRRYLVRRTLLAGIAGRADYSPRFVRARARQAGLSPAELNFSRYFHIGLRSVPEIILSPRALDFPRTPARHQIYAEQSVDLNRQESISDYAFSRRFAVFSAQKEKGVPMVYCSLGTGAWRYRGAKAFWNRVIEASRGRAWNLILAVGTECEIGEFTDAPNIAVFQVVPQLQVLRAASLMITHGGMNSVTECALLGVPMLVYPGSTQIDQAGNAARVVFHGLGLKGRLTTESAGALRRKIERVLGTPEFQRAAQEMSRRLSAGARLEPVVDRLVELARKASDASMPVC